MSVTMTSMMVLFSCFQIWRICRSTSRPSLWSDFPFTVVFYVFPVLVFSYTDGNVFL